MQPLNLPHVVREVEAESARYELALGSNNVATLDALFWNSPLTIRYGLRENLYGFEQIADFRASVTEPGSGGKRRLKTVVTTFGEDMATVNTMFEREATPQRIGRQSQTWVRTPGGWRIVAAHVSIIDR